MTARITHTCSFKKRTSHDSSYLHYGATAAWTQAIFALYFQHHLRLTLAPSSRGRLVSKRSESVHTHLGSSNFATVATLPGRVEPIQKLDSDVLCHWLIVEPWHHRISVCRRNSIIHMHMHLTSSAIDSLIKTSYHKHIKPSSSQYFGPPRYARILRNIMALCVQSIRNRLVVYSIITPIVSFDNTKYAVSLKKCNWVLWGKPEHLHGRTAVWSRHLSVASLDWTL